MIDRDEWLDLARKLDWELSYVDEREAFPEQVSGHPWLPGKAWQQWDEPYRTSFAEYVDTQSAKEVAVAAVRETVGRPEDLAKLDSDRFRIRVSDDGVGLPEHIDIVSPRTLGLDLVATLARQLDAELKVDRKKGTSFALELTRWRNTHANQ